MRNYQGIRDSIEDIFKGTENKQLALDVLEHELKQLDVPEGIISDILAKCGNAITDPDNYEPIVDTLMDKIDKFAVTSDSSNLSEAFFKFSKKPQDGGRPL